MDAFPPSAACTIVSGTMKTGPQEGDFQDISSSNQVSPVWWLQQQGCTSNLRQAVQATEKAYIALEVAWITVTNNLNEGLLDCLLVYSSYGMC